MDDDNVMSGSVLMDDVRAHDRLMGAVARRESPPMMLQMATELLGDIPPGIDYVELGVRQPDGRTEYIRFKVR